MAPNISEVATDVDISQLPSNVSLYVAMWDCNGLEYLYNVSAWDRAQVWSELTGRPNSVERPANPAHLILRAQFNSQRHYEIYTFTVDNTISEDDLREQFRDTPQAIVNLIRDRGNCLHSDRNTTKAVIV